MTWSGGDQQPETIYVYTCMCVCVNLCTNWSSEPDLLLIQAKIALAPPRTLR